MMSARSLKSMEYEIRISQKITNVIGALRIIDNLKNLSPEIESSIVDIYDNNVRIITNLITKKKTNEKKRQIKSEKSSDSTYKFVISEEETIKIDPQSPFILKVYRLRYIYKNWKYIHENKNYLAEIHITFRTEIGNKIKSFVSIEVELPKKYETNIMDGIVREILKIHNGYIIPSLYDKIDTIETSYIDKYIKPIGMLQRPIDMKWSNLTYRKMIEQPHAISFKADGTRMLLLLSDAGTYFITSSYDVIRINAIKNKDTIIDGELMGDTYWAFDIIYSDLDKNISDKNYDERHKYLSNILMSMKTINTLFKLPLIPTVPGHEHPIENINIIKCIPKPIIIPKTTKEFFNAIEQMNDIGIQTDGIIFTPIKQKYSGYVLKWKPQDLLTVDFFVSSLTQISTFKDNSIIELSTLTYNNMPIKYLVKNLSEQNIGTVCEFKYQGINEQNEQVWIYERPRPDKSIPNRYEVYVDIIRIHDDPIEIEAITGKSLRLMRKYHNQVKKELYDMLATDLKAKTITDIGSGRGGDLSKWISNDFDVQAIEPDGDNIREFIRRVESIGGKYYNISSDEYYFFIKNSTIDLVHAKAEDFINNDKIDFDETDVVTSFNSATFLGPKILGDMAMGYTKPNGRLVVMVMDGKIILEKFLDNGNKTEYQSSLIEIQKVQCPTLEEAKSGAIGVGGDMFGNLGCIKIRLIDSSTVQQFQTEGLVDVDELIKSLGDYGFQLENNIILDNEKLLGDEESKYTSAQRLLIFKNGTLSIPNLDILPSGRKQMLTKCPYGDCLRYGVPIQGLQSTENISFGMSLICALEEDFRKLSDINKKAKYNDYIKIVSRDIIKEKIPIYAIISPSWNMIHNIDGTKIELFPYQGYGIDERISGIVLIYINGIWNPVAKIQDNEEYYIW